MHISEAFNKFHCDKEKRHGYGGLYEDILRSLMKQNRKETIRIFEVGIYKGASLEAFVHYFKQNDFENYELYAIDIFERLKEDQIPILKHEKIHAFKADSTKEYPTEIQDLKFDLIIDDGLHTPDAQRMTFMIYSQFLAKDATYIIEDVWPIHLMTPQERKHRWLVKYKDDYTPAQHDMLMDTITQYWYTELDNRRHKHPDSFAFIIKNS